METGSSRKKNVVRNMFVGTSFQIISLILGFVNRTFFIRILGAEYLGVNSLFTNILTILSFAELGIGNAIVYNLYKPIAEGNEKRINVLLKFYRNTYSAIGIVMLVAGFVLIPFIPSLISETPNITENIYIIYVLFLLDTVVSYFFTYRTAIITADQKNYIVVRTVQIFKIVQIFVQIGLLYLTHNYYLYIVLQLLTTIITFSYLYFKSVKMYPFTRKMPNENLPKKEIKSIFDNVKALFVYKFGSVVLNGTDSIIISKYVGLVALGLYSNYYLIISALTQVLSQVFNAFTASIGNLLVSDDNKKSKEIFEHLFYFTVLVFCVCGMCLYFLFNDFISLWLGKEYLLSNLVIFAIVLHFYVNGVQFASFTYRQTAGLFMQYRWAPVIGALANIILSIVLVKIIGLAGVFFATSIARLITAGWIDPKIVYKHVLHSSVFSYFKKYFRYLITVGLVFIICYFVTRTIVVNTIFMFIIKGLILLILSSLLFIFFTSTMKEYKDLKYIGKSFIKKKFVR